MIRETKYNFTKIQNLVNSASFAQEAGEIQKCEEILAILRENLPQGDTNVETKSKD